MYEHTFFFFFNLYGKTLLKFCFFLYQIFSIKKRNGIQTRDSNDRQHILYILNDWSYPTYTE